jgi:CubicO group peptidase (beta-lactamase class C family)
MHFKKRSAVILIAVTALAALSLGSAYVLPMVSVGVAYKAKTVCSGLYVAHQSLEAILAELHIDDLESLRAVRIANDTQARAVTASALGIVRHHASHRAGQGCALHSPTERTGSVDTVHVVTSAAELRVSAPSARLESVLDDAFNEPASGKLRRTRAVVIVHRGEIAAERYSGFEVGPQTPLPGWSMTKSVTNALVGIMVAEGRLSLDTPPPVPEWQPGRDERASITLSQLLRMSSGLHFDEGMTSASTDVMRMLFRVTNTAAYAARLPLEAKPGTRWKYSSGTTNILARAIRSAIRNDREYLAFPRRALFDAIGMHSAVIETDSSGTFVGSSFMYATARDWARFGMLYLQDGVWADRRVLPEGWVRYTTTPAPASSSGEYGAHFWLDVPAEYRRTADDLPLDAFHAVGHEAQFITVIPSRELVIVRLGRTRYPEAWDHVRFVNDILAALGG